MSSEWFYIRQWRSSSRKVWAVIDRTDGAVLKDSLTRREAESMSDRLNDEALATFVVNMSDADNNKHYSIKEVSSENSRPRKTIK